MQRPRVLLIAAAIVVAASACGGGSDVAETPNPTASPAPTPTTLPAPVSSSPTSAMASPSPDAAEVTADIVVENGEVQGGVAQVEVDLGDTVKLRVTSDTAEKIHVHGYDLVQEIAPNDPVTFEFTADIPGQFEIELENSHVKIAELVVKG